MKTFSFVLTLAALLAFVACSSRTDPPGGQGPKPEPMASQSRNITAAPGGHAAPMSQSNQEAAAGPGDASRGADVYAQYCGVCHNNGANGAPPLVGVLRRKELPSGTPANDDRVKDTIRMGRSNMPGFNGVLSDQQINDLVAYMHTL